MSLLMIKSILTTVVLALAIAQGVTGAWLRGHVTFPRSAMRSVRTWHRWGGDVTLLLTLGVAVICLTQPFRLRPLRVPVHAALGSLAALIMVLKVIIARRFRPYLRRALILGAIAGLSVLGVFVASALWYFAWQLQVAVPTGVEMVPTEVSVPQATVSGVELLEERCTACHSLGLVESARKTESEWEATLERMRGHGAVLTDGETEALVQYLVEHYGR